MTHDKPMLRPALWLIRLYQRRLSGRLGVSCPYQPSCSAYGYIAIGRYGLLRGGFMTLWRLLRCHPWTGGGYDPVPRPSRRF